MKRLTTKKDREYLPHFQIPLLWSRRAFSLVALLLFTVSQTFDIYAEPPGMDPSG